MSNKFLIADPFGKLRTSFTDLRRLRRPRRHEGYKGVRAYLHAIRAMLLLIVVLLFFANIDRISRFKLDKSGFEAKTREAEKIVSIGELE